MGRSTISAVLDHLYHVLTGVGLDIIFNGPSGMSTEFTIDSNGVILCLVEDIDFILVSKPHLLSVMSKAGESEGNIPSEQRYRHHQQPGMIMV